jgi:siroheme synthase
VSSAIAVPAAVGIPVTHRGYASSVTIATGHARSDGETDDHDWASLAGIRGTLVFLMAVENLEHIVEQLLSHGRRCDEFTAMIQSGTTRQQRSVFAPLGEITRAAREAEIRPPAVFVVGATVELASESRSLSPTMGV